MVGEKLAGARLDHRSFVILARELDYRFDVGELGDGDELDFIVGGVAPEQESAGLASDSMNSREHIRSQEQFILVRILMRSPAVPDSADHLYLSTTKSLHELCRRRRG